MLLYNRAQWRRLAAVLPYWWNVGSGVALYCSYLIVIVAHGPVTLGEKISMTALVNGIMLCFCWVRKIAASEAAAAVTVGAEACGFCGARGGQRLFHSRWWACCVWRRSRGAYRGGLALGAAALTQLGNAGTAAACRHRLLADLLVVPRDCQGAFDDWRTGAALVVSGYATLYAAAAAITLLSDVLFDQSSCLSLSQRK